MALYVEDGYYSGDYVYTGISVDWVSGVIFVPLSEMILIQSSPTVVYQLNLNEFRLALRTLEAGVEGMPFPTTHVHVAPVSVGGVDLARVVEILEPYTVTFQDGQYAVNLVGANSNVGDRTNVNNVSVRSANSAGLPDLGALQSGVFNDFVSLLDGSIYSGTSYPLGTASFPVNNVPDARAIAEQFNLEGVKVSGAYTFGAGDDLSGLIVAGRNENTTVLNIEDAADFTEASIRYAKVTGTLDNGVFVERCIITDIDFINGVCFNTVLNPGTIRVGGAQSVFFLDCYGGRPDLGTPTLDCNGLDDTATSPVALRGYSGGIRVAELTSGASVSVTLSGGQVIVDPTSTNGTLTVRGTGKVVDENGVPVRTGTVNGALVVINEATNPETTSYATWERDLASYSTGTKAGELLNTALSGGPVEVDEEAIAAAVWDKTVADHQLAGSTGASLATIEATVIMQGGAGVETVNLVLTDPVNGDIPIPAARVQIYDQTGSTLITFQTTDSGGQATFLLDADDYIARVYKPGYSAVDQAFTVADTGGATPTALALEASGITVAPPASPTLCRIYADFITQDGLPLENFKLVVENLFDPESSIGMAVGESTRAHTTDAAGHVEFDLVRGSRVRVSFSGTPLSRDIVVPDQPVESLLTAFGAATDAFQVVTQ